ncbi:MgtC/SapB family protein [Pseudomonas turukhanskensis]|uniref:DUF4010 domain-containing protein n=1 Tax=Pseudomonas turukhanskensis TaxID=1806536 RepID=A0A9W6K2Y0_9PSED|nr:DUF4010 domain-containing protein [Pseudomonas turukhanskensis]GLK88501.1 hypothetical protein GCM10017655_15630 [Pseudomonas turukhanskensis]
MALAELDGFANGAVALGLGLLVGLERERHKGHGAERACAGLRTFAITALLGFVSNQIGVVLLAAVAVALTLLVTVAYLKSQSSDPGITSEIALLTTLLLGALCTSNAALAGALAVVMTALLTYRQPLHQFVRHQLSALEVRDGLILLTAALVILPLAPDRYIGPYGALNLRNLCALTVMLMAVGAIGHIAVRALGVRYGYAVSAVASGFASSAATIASLGAVAKRTPEHVRSLAAAALLSNLATFVQVGLILGAVDTELCIDFLAPLAAGAMATGCIAGWLARGREAADTREGVAVGGAFETSKAVMLTVLMGGVMLLGAVMQHLFGERGLLVAMLVGGFADAHAPTAAVASLVDAGQLTAQAMALPVLLALSSNTLSKCALAWGAGGRKFAGYIIPAQLLILLLMALAAWLQGTL